jgi:Arc/MetJ family transcription regulator
LYRELPDGLWVHPQRIDLLRDALLMVRVDARTLAEASFLDERIVTRNAQAGWFTWPQVAERLGAGCAATPAHYLFHIGHCGSTLISRLLGELGIVQLREPLPLRTLAEVQVDLDAFESRWSRTTFAARLALLAALFDRGDGPRAVKATSHCNDLAPALLAGHATRCATIIFTRLRPYLANVLAGPNSRLDLLGTAPQRLRRLAARIDSPVGRLHEMSPGVLAGMSWVAETASLAATLDGQPPGRVLTLDFDRFLADLRPALRRLADHLAPGIEDSVIARAAASPTLSRYSKSPEHAYDLALRRAVREDAERCFGAEIRAGLSWCTQLASRHPKVARALALFDHA